MENLIAESDFFLLYNIAYGILFLFAILTILYLDIRNTNYKSTKLSSTLSFVIILFFTIIVGLREYNVGTDTYNYHLFNWVYGYRSESHTEIIFDTLITILKKFNLTFTAFLSIISVLFYYFVYRALKNFSAHLEINVLIIAFIFFSLFFSKSLSINVIRQGLSLALLLYALSLWIMGKSKIMRIVFISLAVLTHMTSLIPILLFVVISSIGKKFNLNVLIWIYIIVIAVSALGVGVLTVAPFLESALSGDKYSAYLLSETEEYVVGFKLQFVIFNSIFLYIFYRIYNSFTKTDFLKEKYKILLYYYILSSILFFLMFQIPYSDRFGLFSWIIIPILIGPILKKENKILSIKTPVVIFFLVIYLFFIVYGNNK